jgi:hypothetical protein
VAADISGALKDAPIGEHSIALEGLADQEAVTDVLLVFEFTVR